MNESAFNRKRSLKQVKQGVAHKKPKKLSVKTKHAKNLVNNDKSTEGEVSGELIKENEQEFEESEDEIQCEVEELHQDDPFRLQYDFELSSDLLNALSSKPPHWSSKTIKWPNLGNIRFSQPEMNTSVENSATLSIMEDTKHSKIRSIVPCQDEFDLEEVYVKSQIARNVRPTNQRYNTGEELSGLQREMFQIVSNYQDLYSTDRTFSNSEDIRLVYCCHAVNHALKTRMKILNNNSKISKGSEHDFRDHGLVRPKVLILVPFRDAALRVVKMISSLLLGDSGNVMHKKRFLDAYSGDTIRMPKKNPKPPDYEQTFYGNTDDNFKLGIALTKKSMKLYVDFYSSDIIVASPLGLRILIGAEGEANRDHDFLSSIELLIIDQADILVMQNWEHVLHIISHLHLVPKDSHGTDLTRVRMWALSGWSRYYLQLLIFTSHPLPEVSALFSHQSANFGGRVVVSNPVGSGSIRQIIVPVPQLFHEISVDSVVDAVERRFEAFVSKFLPQLRDPMMKHTLIYVPSYFDYVRIRNHFKKQDISFVQICEYSKEGKIARARDLFYHGEVHFMLYSERFHFFRRVRVKGIRHILFYQPPAFPHFYSEISNLMKDIKTKKDTMGQNDLSITTLYTKYDISQLAAIVGTDRATRMLASEKSVHMLMTDDSQA